MPSAILNKSRSFISHSSQPLKRTFWWRLAYIYVMDSAVLNSHQKQLQRPQTNDNLNGPRVSFNKDVHVKRIGKPNIVKRFPVSVAHQLHRMVSTMQRCVRRNAQRSPYHSIWDTFAEKGL